MKVKHDRFSEQYDHALGEYIDKVKTKYAVGIGLFLIRFSSLEHTLDICILDLLSDREHSSGYILIEGISPNSKINLFRKRSVRPTASLRFLLPLWVERSRSRLSQCGQNRSDPTRLQ